MPKCKMLVNANFDQLRVAIVGENGLLEQVDFESLNNDNNLGNIYKATVTAIEPSLQACFVDYGGNRHGFLPFNEIHHRYYVKSDRRLPTQDRLKVGMQVIIQVIREEIGLKGAYVSTYLSLPGQYLVMMPLTSKVGISRKIEGRDERNSMRQMLEQVTVPDGMGYIIRTAGLGKTREQLQRDLNLLTTTWTELEARSQTVASPSLLYCEDDVVTRTIRDYFNEEIKEILIDDPAVFQTVSKYFKKMMPNYFGIVKQYRGKTPLFTRYRLDEQVESIFATKIQLPSGGSIVIEQTEALVVIDVNSGKTSEGNLEATAFKSNLEAADEVARQLRLRDLGGLVVIDFIDLREKRHSQDVEKRLREALKQDKARITVLGLSRFGLLEMSRQRINTSKQIRHYVPCPTCNGIGRIKSMEMESIELLRRIKQHVSNRKLKELKITCEEALGVHILNERRLELGQLEEKFGLTIRIQVRHGFAGKPAFESIKRSPKEEKEDMVMPAPLSLSSMAASMSEQAINEQKDYREEKLDALSKLAFEELRSVDIPTPAGLTPFERFNFSVRVTLMKRHGLYESRLEEFKESLRDSIVKGRSKDELPKPKEEIESEGGQSETEENPTPVAVAPETSEASEDAEPEREPARAPMRSRRGRGRGRRPRGGYRGGGSGQGS
ncbi:MAG: Rne/Rng family ribonuclease [Acidobacteriota bacterium]|nr:Rne/Rng family ribonuclease [Acidobacteriota bacterium]